MQKKQRQPEFEILRIVAMLMIVCLHYLSKGGLLTEPYSENISLNGYIAWFVEAFCVVAVNIYVLISGYFGIGNNGSSVWKRIYNVWIKVIFYSVFVGIIFSVAAMFNIGDLEKPDIYKIFCYVFPIVTEHYWFATSYVILCIFIPFINAGFEKLEKKDIEILLGILLLVFCISKTVIPMQLPWDKYGYDAFWFVTVYITGGYIKKFGIGFIKNKRTAFMVYAFSQLLVFVCFVALRQVYLSTGMFNSMISYSYSYNFLLCYTGAIGLFCLFDIYSKKQKNISKNVPLCNLTTKLSGATFGVYLIHEHIDIRGLWGIFVDSDTLLRGSSFVFILNLIVTVFIVYAACTFIELLRQTIGEKIEKLRKHK
ncbi:MAG: acyltransferase [Lachnospiraceae bacterium]|nr:acyltransferase [Lachnospiraceae bacterium]